MRSQPAHHTLQATALVHETYARLARRGITAHDHAGFVFAAARAMRDILVESARARQRQQSRHRDAVGRRMPVSVAELESADPDGSLTLAVDAALSTLEREAPDLAAVVRLRFFGGLSGDQTAEVLTLSPRQVDRLWTYARARLFGLLKDELG